MNHFQEDPRIAGAPTKCPRCGNWYDEDECPTCTERKVYLRETYSREADHEALDRDEDLYFDTLAGHPFG